MPFFWVISVHDDEHNSVCFEGKLHEQTLADTLADIWWWQGIGNITGFFIDYES